MDVRPFRTTDRTACLAIFDSLAPEVVDPGSRVDFERFLDNPQGPYFVMEHNDVIVGCGGYDLSEARDTATLLWGMVRNDSRNLGLGRFLLLYRIREIGKAGNVGIVRAIASSKNAGFFEKQGFRVGATVAGGIEFVKKLTVCG